MDLSIDLPDVFPDGVIKVEDEAHEYEVYDDGSARTEYTLDKAGGDAIKNVDRVASQPNADDNAVFEKGVDYELSADNEKIVWLDGDRPDANDDFYVTYRVESIISRYRQSGEDELSEAEQMIMESIDAKLINKAEGKELDELGKLFGPVVGKRRNRNDPVYRIYLKSIAQSFISRGTRAGIRAAVGAAIGIDPNKITINEDFENSSYEVELPPVSAHAASTVEDIAEIADPSGIEQELTRYILPAETIGIRDNVSTNPHTTSVPAETLGITDTISTDPYTTSLAETAGVTDSWSVDPNTTSIAESGGINDTVTSEVTVIAWDTGDWDSMNWN